VPCVAVAPVVVDTVLYGIMRGGGNVGMCSGIGIPMGGGMPSGGGGIPIGGGIPGGKGGGKPLPIGGMPLPIVGQGGGTGVYVRPLPRLKEGGGMVSLLRVWYNAVSRVHANPLLSCKESSSTYLFGGTTMRSTNIGYSTSVSAGMEQCSRCVFKEQCCCCTCREKERYAEKIPRMFRAFSLIYAQK
jgi:hypothetical protein